MKPTEILRNTVISEILSLSTVQNVWPTWNKQIHSIVGSSTLKSSDLNKIGDNLYKIFKSTSNGRGQSDVSSGGAAWEALVCWYLNLCLIGSRTVVIKSKKANIPKCISDSINVNYGNFTSNTESDLLAITFPDTHELSLPFSGSHKDLMRILTDAVEQRFIETELGIIQCKTNWNDNAQIPMLWDLIYASTGFSSAAKVGTNGFSHTKLKKFTYSFVTVPTVEPSKFKATSTPVMRVKNLSGGNYWGLPTKSGVASNLFGIIQSNFQTSHNSYTNGWHKDIVTEIQNMKSNGNVFKL
ncbi:hypothetical protein KUV56_13240 [Ferrimonas balearica]|uniref:hypothetical protein n=1 Tax=Ferrimonas balearica TaxID=44012 RepID=UPI001C56C9C0|nr:hypothetical protein [Ferrimonas balearica]MBW3140462.1 hypothetical protein [Ferrimonas balearica]